MSRLCQPEMMHNFIGTRTLLGLALRRDRVKLPLSLGAVGLMVPVLLTGVKDIFSTTEAMREGIAFLSSNPAMRLFGLPSGDEFGQLVMLRGFVMFALISALLSTFLAVRHTRQNEELGRLELVGAAVVGRYAGLASAFLLLLLVNSMLSGLFFLGFNLVEVGIGGGLPQDGSLLLAVAVGAIGLIFGALAALIAQLTQTSRTANSLAAASVGAAFLLSGVASVLGTLRPSGVYVDPLWPIWLSPIGWGQMLRPFAEHNLEVLAVFAGVFLLLCFTAFWLIGSRDVGQGIFSVRGGKPEAGGILVGPGGLTWRLQRGMFFGWLAGISFLGAIYGVVSGDVEQLLAEAEGILDIFVAATGSSEIILAYFGSIVGVLSTFVLAYAVQAVVRMRTEESRALEMLLATRLSRGRWFGVQFGFTFLSVSLMLLVAGFMTGVVAEIAVEGSVSIMGPVILGALVQLPAILLIVGIITAVFAWRPNGTTGIAWSVFATTVLLGPFFGSLFGLPEAWLNLSVLTHTPIMPPTDNFEFMPLVAMAFAAAMLYMLSLFGFKRRDIARN